MTTVRVVSICAALLIAGCTASQPTASRAQPRSGDPALSGADYLLSEPDFRAILAVARHRLADLAPHCSISEVDVISSTRVDAWFCRNDWEDRRGMLELEKRNGQWMVVREQGGRPNPNQSERVII